MLHCDRMSRKRRTNLDIPLNEMNRLLADIAAEPS